MNIIIATLSSADHIDFVGGGTRCLNCVVETRQRLITAAPPPAKDTEQDLSISVSYILRIYTYILRQCAGGLVRRLR